LLNLIDCTTMN